MLRIHLFGNFRMQDGERKLQCFQSSKARELFCYLLLHREHPHSRESLACRFWADCDKNQSRKYLRQSLWQMHQSIRDARGGLETRFVKVDGEFVSWDDQADVWVDVPCFEQAFASAGRMASEHLTHGSAESLRQAAALYEGDLMEGWYHDWCLFHRERLHNDYLILLEKLLDYSELHRDYEAGLAYGERLLHQDKFREPTYVRMMRLHYLAGDRAGAIRQFQRCAATLQEELAIRPSRQTVEVYERIRMDQFDIDPQPGRPAANDMKTPEVTLSASTLRQLKSGLLSLQQQLQHQIQTIDKALENQPVSSSRE